MKRSAINAALMLFVAAAVGAPSWRSSRADDVAPPQLSAEARPIDEAEARGLADALRRSAKAASGPRARARVRIALRHSPAPVEDGVGTGSAADETPSATPAAEQPAAAVATERREARQSRMRHRIRTKTKHAGSATPPSKGPDVARGLLDDADELGKGASGRDKAGRKGGAAGVGRSATRGPEGGQRLHASPESVKRKGTSQGTGVGPAKGSGGDRGMGRSGTSGHGRKLSPVGGSGAGGSGGTGGGGRRAR